MRHWHTCRKSQACHWRWCKMTIIRHRGVLRWFLLLFYSFQLAICGQNGNQPYRPYRSHYSQLWSRWTSISTPPTMTSSFRCRPTNATHFGILLSCSHHKSYLQLPLWSASSRHARSCDNTIHVSYSGTSDGDLKMWHFSCRASSPNRRWWIEVNEKRPGRACVVCSWQIPWLRLLERAGENTRNLAFIMILKDIVNVV